MKSGDKKTILCFLRIKTHAATKLDQATLLQTKAIMMSAY